MASLIVRKLDATVIVLDDIGLTLTGPNGTTFDLLSEQANDISLSADLVAALSGSPQILEVLDPRDGTTALSVADGILVVQNHNLPHFGIQGGRFDGADDPANTFLDNYVLEYDSTLDEWTPFPHEHLFAGQGDTIGEVIAGMGIDGTDTTYTYTASDTFLVGQGIQDETYYDGDTDFLNGSFFGGTSGYVISDTITLSDGSIVTVDNVAAGVVTEFTVTTSGETVVTEGVALTQASTSGGGTGFTLTPEARNTTPGSMEWSVNDSFLRNTGDTLDSGTLNIASGASIAILTGGDLTIADAPVSGTDAANKDYVDSVAAGLDPKESVRYCTVASVGGTYNPTGGTGGSGEFTGVDLTSAAIWDGLTGGAIQVGDRLLVKSETGGSPDTTVQNGIYVVTTAGAAGVIERAPDHDGTPANEVSGGNFTFVEEGTTCQSTGWVLAWDGDIVLNTDPIVFVQFSESTVINAGVGISQGGQDLDLDINTTLGTTNAIVGADLVAFHDADGAAAGSGSGSQTYARTFTNMLADLDIVNGLPGNGFAVQTGTDTYTNRSIVASASNDRLGLDVVNGDGVAGNPTVGLSIETLSLRAAIDTTDRVPVYDVSLDTNIYYTISDIAGALSTTNSFETWAGSGNTTGDASIVADSGTDTATLTGGRAINIDFNAAGSPVADELTFQLTKTTDMTGTVATAVGDSVLFFDADNSDQVEVRTWTNIISDLGLVTSLAASTDEDLLGIDVTGSTIGLDIIGLTDPDANMDASDEFVVSDKSEGVSSPADGANRKMTGQNIADGVADILNIQGITISTINGQSILTINDPTRGGGSPPVGKQLSAFDIPFMWAENNAQHLDWIEVGNAVDADSGYIMPLQGTIVYATGHCENTGGNSKDIHLFVDGVDQGSVGSLTGGANAEYFNTTLDINFTQNAKLRLQAQGSGTGAINDVVLTVFVRWRA